MGVLMGLDHSQQSPPVEGQSVRLVTDGGQTTESGEDGQQELSELFCAVTGTDEITERQESDDHRVVAEHDGGSLAGDVTDVAREDGLGDTLPEPDPGGE